MDTTAASGGEASSGTADPALVDPRAPRFGQTLTAGLLTIAVLLRRPLLVGLVTVVLVTAVLTRWRVDVWGLLWRHGASRVVDPPAEREPAAPHRFAKLVGAGFTLVASALLAVGGPLAAAGYAVAGLVALLAGIAAVLDVCVGCRFYRQVGAVRRLGIV